MDKLLILCDLDKTLIDKYYKLTTDISNLRKVIERAQNKGHLVGLHSDTPLSVLRTWARKFKMSGPLVGENGSVVQISEAIQNLTTNRSDMNIAWQSLKSEINFFLVGIGYTVVETNDYLDYLDQKHSGLAGKKLIVVNGCRQHSLAYFVRSVDPNGLLVKDKSLFKKVNDLILKEFPLLKEADQDLNPEYTLSIFSLKGANKGNAMPVLCEYFSDYKVVMIGDGVGDIAMHKKADCLYAVNNAVPALKAVADKIATKAITEGVIEIINDII